MATYTSGPKISAAVSASRTSTGTLYTCPAASYAIVRINENTSAGTTSWTLDGRSIVPLTDTGSPGLKKIDVLYIGPGQALVCTIGTTATCTVVGVEFVNAG